MSQRNTLAKSWKILATVISALFLMSLSTYAAEGAKSLTPDEMRRIAAEKAAALAKPPPGGKWRATAEEALKALKLKGDVEEGEEIYTVCAACHQPTGWGDPLGVFPQLAGQHTTVLIKQIADIRAGNRDNPTMYPFAMQIEGSQDIVDACSYIQVLKMNPNPRVGTVGQSWVLSNLRKEVWPISLDKIQQDVGNENFKKLKSIEEQNYNSKDDFIAALAKTIGTRELEKHKTIILNNADWVTDLELGKQLYEKNCVKCHGDHAQGNWQEDLTVVDGEDTRGEDSKKEPAYYPVLAGQTYLYLIRQFSWIQIGKRRNANPDMIKQIKEFNFLDMKSVVDYASRFVMQEGDWQPVGEEEEEGWDLEKDDDEEDEDMPAHLR